MKKILMIICGAIIVLNSCKKTVNETVAGSNTLLLAYPSGTVFNTLSSGLNYFNNSLLTFSLSDAIDTLTVSANIGIPASKDLTVTIGADANALAAYNANKSDTVKYAAMPTNYYSIPNNSVTIKAGQTSAVFKIAFYPSLFDITQTGYLLPLSINNNPGYAVNNNMKTVYFHINKDPFPPYSRANWKITGVSDEETVGEGPNNGRAIYILDGNPLTYWHTIWDVPSPPGFPHWVTIDMGVAQTIHGFYFLNRQIATDDHPKGCVMSGSTDGVTWTTIGQFTLLDQTALQKVVITPVNNIRYFKTTFTSNFDSNPWTNLAELQAY